MAGTLNLDAKPILLRGLVVNASLASGHQRLSLAYEELVFMKVSEPLLTVR